MSEQRPSQRPPLGPCTQVAAAVPRWPQTRPAPASAPVRPTATLASDAVPEVAGAVPPATR